MSGWADKLAIPILVAVVGIVATALAGRWSEAVSHRRDGYAAAVATLVAWIEFPYRIRRRTSDSPEELARLAGLGHDLQERLSCHATWIAAESRWLGIRYAKTLAAISGLTSDANNEAWRHAPATTGADMILGDWGPGAPGRALVHEFQGAVGWRFGVRRAVGWLDLRRLRH
ncbi:MAG: hypothetical protein ACYDAC_12675 [Candidatus Dormibacteria bacterium]